MTDNNELESRIRRVLIDSLSLNIAEDELQYGESFEEIIGLDSLAALEFLTAIEKEFGVAFEEDELDLAVLGDLPTLAKLIRSRSSGSELKTKT